MSKLPCLNLLNWYSCLQQFNCPRRQKPRYAKKHFPVILYCWGTQKRLWLSLWLNICFLGPKGRCFCFRGIGTPIRESDVRGRLSGSLLTSRLDITAMKLWQERQSRRKGFSVFFPNSCSFVRLVVKIKIKFMNKTVKFILQIASYILAGIAGGWGGAQLWCERVSP